MKLTDDDREKLREFETEDLLLAVDHLDEMRGELADDGIRPPPIRMKLLELHQIAFDVIKRGINFLTVWICLKLPMRFLNLLRLSLIMPKSYKA